MQAASKITSLPCHPLQVPCGTPDVFWLPVPGCTSRYLRLLDLRADTCVCLILENLHGLPQCLLHDPVLLDAVARIALVKPDKARGVENMVLQMAQRGQLTEKVRVIHKAGSNARDIVEDLMGCACMLGLLQLVDAVAAAQVRAARLTAPCSHSGSVHLRKVTLCCTDAASCMLGLLGAPHDALLWLSKVATHMSRALVNAASSYGGDYFATKASYLAVVRGAPGWLTRAN